MIQKTVTVIKGSDVVFRIGSLPLPISDYTNVLIDLIPIELNEATTFCKLSKENTTGYTKVITIEDDCFVVPISSTITSTAETTTYDMLITLITSTGKTISKAQKIFKFE